MTEAKQEEHCVSMTLTFSLLAVVDVHALVLLPRTSQVPTLQLNAYAPMYMALIDPPCEFAA